MSSSTRLRNRLVVFGEETVTLDSDGNGTLDVAFPETFNRPPKIMVVGPADDEKGKYGVKNDHDMLLFSGRKLKGGISACTTDSGKAKFTDDASATGTITVFADNGDGRTKVTDATHGLTGGESIQIVNTVSYDGFYADIEYVDANNFIIDRPFVADDAKGSWFIHDHDLQEDDRIRLKGTNSHNGEHDIYSVSAAYFTIDRDYVAADAKGWWELLPSISTSGFTIQVIGGANKGETVNVYFLAMEKLGA